MHVLDGGGHGSGGFSRRSAIAGSFAAVVGGALFSAAACSSDSSDSASETTAAPAPEAAPKLPDTALITLGVAAGPPPIRGRIGISSALKIGDDVYQIDCGLGSFNAFTNAGLSFENLKSMFITHLHTDHMVDYFSFFLSGGYTAKPDKAAVNVYGPGPAGGLPDSQLGNPNPPTVDPENPARGLAFTTAALVQAYAYTSNLFIRDMGTVDIQNTFKVTEIAVPPGSDFRNRSPKTDPFPVASDDNIDVTATLVSHYDVYPAFAFRFDLKKSGMSITFSGDTTKSDNLIRLAKDTDILVHEAEFSLDDSYYGNRFPPNYLKNSHTSAEQVGEVAAAANAKHVILSHYQPSDLPDSEWLDKVGKHYSGKITVGKDGGVFEI
ncbi:MBL fold metallo-hydrolase [Antrihabitans stalactiti]|uniref:MBL fold metallo-hydrolase n=1 Tax=Antrihabitans stalactiti TaxID=2584121 RepID=A0A848KDQ2_9NOCA|nr:MBL fold metallo-hydrolase [Antrihabitans stalactiti]NMN96361.1 MBL fold metallo-hydrolase [Antrihabitans stalactiti]